MFQIKQNHQHNQNTLITWISQSYNDQYFIDTGFQKLMIIDNKLNEECLNSFRTEVTIIYKPVH